MGSNLVANGGEAYNVAVIVVHHQWNPTDFSNDIALIKTVEFMKYSTRVQPIILGNFDPSIGQNAVLSGFGSLNVLYKNLFFAILF